MFLPRLIPSKGVAMAAAGLMAVALSSCDSSFVFEDLRPCVPDYRVRLSYMKNMANEERASQIQAAEVYAFDKEGKLVTVSKADYQTLKDNDWTLPLDIERFQDYDLFVWGGLTSESPFFLDGSRAVTSQEDLACHLATDSDEEHPNYSDRKFPGLFHGTTSVSFTVEDGTEERTVPMMKNTNDINVLIQKETGAPVEEGYYVVEIVDANGDMDHQNNVSGDEVLYRQHTYTAGDFRIPDGYGGKEETYAASGQWEFSVARLMENSDARIRIRLGDSNITIFDDKLIDLLLSRKPSNMDKQDYLDREDTYYLTFRLRVEEDWLHVSVFVNDWLIIKNNMEWE